MTIQKRHEVCKACKFAAPCYGLGLRVVLQMLLDRGHGLGTTLPCDCPLFEKPEWGIYQLDGALVVVPRDALQDSV